MKRILAIVALCASVVCAAPNVFLPNPKTVTWTLSGGQYWAKYGGATPGPYAWDTAYSNTVLLWELYATNTPTTDSSFIGTNVGTLGASSAKPTYVAATGGVSACYSFDGGDVIWRPQIQSLVGTGNKSVTMWVMGTAQATPISWGNLSADGSAWQAYLEGTLVGLQTHNGPRYWDTTARNIGVWYHVAIGHSSANTTSSWAYLNGVALAVNSTLSGSNRAIDTASGTNFIGRSVNPAGPAFWAGKIDRPQIYDRSLTAAEVLSNFWMTAAPMTTNGGHGWTAWQYANRSGLASSTVCKAAYNFNYSGVADDTSGNGNHGTLSATTWQAQGGTYPNGWLHFNGINSYAYAPDINTLDGISNMTQSIWIRPESTVNPSTIMFKQASSSARFLITQYQTNGLIVAVCNGNASSYGYTATGCMTNNVWSHLTVVFDGSGANDADKLKLYVNARSLSLTYGATIPTTTPSVAGVAYIGTPDVSGNQWFTGDMDDWQQFGGNGSTYSFSALAVTNLYNAGKPFHP